MSQMVPRSVNIKLQYIKFRFSYPKQLPLISTFVDCKKAFDSADRTRMSEILCHYGIPEKIVAAIMEMYKDTSSRVTVNGQFNKLFYITKGRGTTRRHPSTVPLHHRTRLRPESDRARKLWYINTPRQVTTWSGLRRSHCPPGLRQWTRKWASNLSSGKCRIC